MLAVIHASFEPSAKVLHLTFSGSLTTEDVDAIDPLIARVMVERHCADGVRTLFDMRHTEALAVPSSRFAERARLAPIGKLMRVVVAPPWADACNFGRSYRDAQAAYFHSQPTIVPTLHDAYGLLSLVNPHFEPFDGGPIAENADECAEYVVRVTPREADAIGWKIVRIADGHEVARSSRTFTTRVETLADSAIAAASLIAGFKRKD